MDLLFAGTLPPHQGGSAIASARMLGGLAARGYRVRAVAPIPDAALRAGDRFARDFPAIDVTRFAAPPVRPRSPLSTDEYRRVERTESLALVERLIGERRPDAVLVGRESFAWDIPKLAEHEGVPCVVLVHGGTTFRLIDHGDPAPEARRLLRQLRAATWIVAPAHHLADRLRELGLTNVTVIRNAVELEDFHPGPRDPKLARRLEIEEENVVVMHLSNLGEVKRPLDVVHSAEAVLRRGPELVYVVVGEGPYRRAMEESCAERGIAGSFRFTGWVDYGRVPDYLRLADIAVVSSASEGQALVCLEAQACGRTVIASDIAGAREVVVDGRTGLLFPTGDVEALAEKTLRAAQDCGLRQSLGRAAREQVKRHSHREAIRAYDELLGGLVSASAAAG